MWRRPIWPCMRAAWRKTDDLSSQLRYQTCESLWTSSLRHFNWIQSLPPSCNHMRNARLDLPNWAQSMQRIMTNNTNCFNSLSFEVVCYTEVNNWNTGQRLFKTQMQTCKNNAVLYPFQYTLVYFYSFSLHEFRISWKKNKAVNGSQISPSLFIKANVEAVQEPNKFHDTKG